MLNISNGVSLTMDAHGRIQADGLKNLPEEKADEIRLRIKDNRDSIVEYLTLWNKALELADHVDGNTAPYEDRIEKLPELNMLNDRMTVLECKIKSNPQSPGQAIEPDPTSQGTKTCRACGGNQWWRLNEPNAKWICGRCHPPVPWVDVIWGKKI